MPATSPVELEVRDVRAGYGGSDVLRGVSLRAAAGERLVLTGPSGAGKSTLLRAIVGLAAVRDGQILLDGEPLTAQSVWRLRQKVALVDQEPDLGDGTARQALQRPFGYRANHHLAENLARVPALFDRFALEGALLDQPMDQLSGGQKQRVALIAALLLERGLILLDEASSALDEANRQAVLEALVETGATLVAVAHDPAWQAIATKTLALPAPTGGKP